MPRGDPDLPEPESPQFVPAALRASLGFLLSRVGGESRRRFTQTLTEWDLRSVHYGVLMVLMELGAASQRELATIVGVDPRNLVAVVDLLEERGLAVREPHPGDRRRYSVRLTEVGRTELARMRAASDAAEEEMLSALNHAERAVLHDLLSRLLPAVRHGAK